MQYLYLFLISLLFGGISTIIFKIFFSKIKLLDNPQKYGKKRAPVPYSMGICLFFGFFVLSYFFLEHTYKLYLIWLFGFIITVVSFLDDLMNLSPKIRLFIQIIIGAIIGVSAIKIGYISNIFGGILDLNEFYLDILGHKIFLVSMIFTIIWYVFIFNALNWTDGISGNTSGLSIISFFILFLLGIILLNTDDYVGGIQNANFIIGITIILIGILIPFWFFDFREKILMGDSGTMFLGFMLATLAIIAGGKIATVLMVFGIYCVDAIYVILNRIKNKKSPLKGDYTHLHHRLMALGLSRYGVLAFVYFFSLAFGITALFLNKTGKILVFILIVFFVVFIDKFIYKIKKNEKN